MVIRIRLNKGETWVDHEDFIRLQLDEFNWCLDGRGYAQRHAWVNGSRTTIRLHRLIVDAKPGDWVDHVNGDRLDNTRKNLRICSVAENCQNAKRRRDNKTGYKGVSILRNGRYQVRLQHNGKQMYFGTYGSAIEAAKVYDKHAKERFKEFAVLNFPQPKE